MGNIVINKCEKCNHNNILSKHKEVMNLFKKHKYLYSDILMEHLNIARHHACMYLKDLCRENYIKMSTKRDKDERRVYYEVK